MTPLRIRPLSYEKVMVLALGIATLRFLILSKKVLNLTIGLRVVLTARRRRRV